MSATSRTLIALGILLPTVVLLSGGMGMKNLSTVQSAPVDLHKTTPTRKAPPTEVQCPFMKPADPDSELQNQRSVLKRTA